MTSEGFADYPSINNDSTSLSHWTYFPPMPHNDRFASPQTFRVLVASVGGRFAIATLALRSAPDTALAGSLASLIDDPEFALVPIDLVIGEFWRRTGQTAELYDVDLDQDNPIPLTSVIPRAIARLARTNPGGLAKDLGLIGIRAELSEQLEATWASTRSNFIAGLAQAAVTHARGIDGLKPSTYALLNSTHDPVKRRNRIQALTLWPILQPVLLTREFARVLKSIDSGDPLVDALADHFNVAKLHIRALRSVTPVTLGTLAQNLGILFELLREINADFIPRDVAAWGSFAAAVDTIKAVSRREITSSTNKLWLRQCAKKGYKISKRTPDEMIHLGQRIDNFVSHLLQCLSWAVAQARKQRFEITPQATEVVIEFKAAVGLDGLADLARRFEDAYRKTYDAFAQEAELWAGVRWPSLAGGTHSFGEILVVQLLTPDELRSEGKEMDHCVAQYVERCITGASLVWSIRRDGRRLATLDTEIAHQPNGPFALKIRQCVGHGNSAASHIALEAANDLVQTVSNEYERMVPFVESTRKLRLKSLDARQRHALMAPIAQALEVTLFGKNAWSKLIAMVKPV